MRNNKAQSSVEYIVVVAIALMIILPGSMLFHAYTTNSRLSVLHSQVFNIGNTLVDTGTEMYAIGDNSWKTIEISMPEEISTIKIFNFSNTSEVEINYGIGETSDGVFFSDLILCNATTCNCTTGCPINFHVGINSVRIMVSEGKVYYKVVQ